ncbi:hypothetical protein SPRG_09688 [Saprolegnia parasitica CBS 223.65]|uniref:Uncharacterized protein n=1 Tax=Saprolegnia parasitica (strain CBS 223.65) TaxID=695850 RepID=A0A067CE84_SAPPC|nr:hypothetical protein SPRG_09688 [Saprolegnia parasitica CBS 223.65]KDO24856.1 hypothetical protein SPRG_09688 [Saprolegnia parasitica CBS 223.65]|eukprot:XP_012204502.1 hypothetical protein SPRG_09688 [Saprolegnia parasitica CBS 223.65]
MAARQALTQGDLYQLICSYQVGVFLDVRPRFCAFHNFVTYEDASDEDEEAEYVVADGFVTSASHLVHNTSGQDAIGASDLGLAVDDGPDDRFPLHLAIAEGAKDDALRILACRPDLASEEAIDVAILHNHLALAHCLIAAKKLWPGLACRSILSGSSRLEKVGTSLVYSVVAHDAPALLDFLVAYQDIQKWPADLLKHAIQHNASVLASVLYASDPSLADARTLDAAAAKGYLTLVQQLDATGIECSTKAMDQAARHGFLDVVRFLHEHRTEGCSDAALRGASEAGRLDVVRFLVDHRTEGDLSAAFVAAAKAGRVRVVEYLGGVRDGCVHLQTTRDTRFGLVTSVLATGGVDVLLYLSRYDRIYHLPRDCDDISSLLTSRDPVAAVRYIVERGVQWKATWMDEACGIGHWDLVQFFYKHSPAGCTTNALTNAVASGHLDIAAFLMDHCDENGSADALTTAVETDNVRMLECLWHRYPKHRGKHLLYTARSSGRQACIAFLRLRYEDDDDASDSESAPL